MGMSFGFQPKPENQFFVFLCMIDMIAVVVEKYIDLMVQFSI